MTTPSERCRSLRYAAGILDELTVEPSERCRFLPYAAGILAELRVEPSVTAELAGRARARASSYPPPSVIDALEKLEPVELTPDQIKAIDDTRAFFVKLPCRKPESWDVIEGILRHYPLPNEGNAGFLIWPPSWPRDLTTKPSRVRAAFDVFLHLIWRRKVR